MLHIIARSRVFIRMVVKFGFGEELLPVPSVAMSLSEAVDLADLDDEVDHQRAGWTDESLCERVCYALACCLGERISGQVM